MDWDIGDLVIIVAVSFASFFLGMCTTESTIKENMTPKNAELGRICYNAPFKEYQDCKVWAKEQLLLGHTEEELKAELEDDEEEDKEAMDCASYPNQHGCGRSV